jgi:hypothetical protein
MRGPGGMMGDGALEPESDAVDVTPSSPSLAARHSIGSASLCQGMAAIGSSIPRRGAASFVTFRTTPSSTASAWWRIYQGLSGSTRQRARKTTWSSFPSTPLFSSFSTFTSHSSFFLSLFLVSNGHSELYWQLTSS